MKIALVANTSWNLYNSRLGLAVALQAAGHDVMLVAPLDEFTQMLLDQGLRWVELPLQPRGKNPLKEVRSVLRLAELYRRERPQVANHFTPKGVIYGSIAARLARVPRIINTITGLGHVYAGTSHFLLRSLVTALYRMSLHGTRVLFQNPDDRNFFVRSGIVEAGQSILTSGSGIDLSRFQVVPEPEGSPVVMLSSRFVEEKGLRYFVEASRILRTRGLVVRFVLVGRPEPDQPTAISEAEISLWIGNGLVEWWGWRNNMPDVYPLANIVCLPTYYMEGIPKSLIEAAACGRALVATDVPGCREIVQRGENGLLVPARNAAALADAIAVLAADPALRTQMGLKGRDLAASSFSIERVVAEYMLSYGLAPTAS
jgi:glycosyltransferase involved in cell wall biosynthesis